MSVDDGRRSAMELLAESLFPVTHHLMDADEVTIATTALVRRLNRQLTDAKRNEERAVAEVGELKAQLERLKLLLLGKALPDKAVSLSYGFSDKYEDGE